MEYTFQFEPGPVIGPLESREDLVRARCASREEIQLLDPERLVAFEQTPVGCRFAKTPAAAPNNRRLSMLAEDRRGRERSGPTWTADRQERSDPTWTADHQVTN